MTSYVPWIAAGLALIALATGLLLAGAPEWPAFAVAGIGVAVCLKWRGPNGR